MPGEESRDPQSRAPEGFCYSVAALVSQTHPPSPKKQALKSSSSQFSPHFLSSSTQEGASQPRAARPGSRRAGSRFLAAPPAELPARCAFCQLG